MLKNPAFETTISPRIKKTTENILLLRAVFSPLQSFSSALTSHICGLVGVTEGVPLGAPQKRALGYFKIFFP